MKKNEFGTAGVNKARSKANANPETNPIPQVLNLIKFKKQNKQKTSYNITNF